MTHLWSLADFQNELTHLSELHEKRPGSPVFQTMLNQFCQKVSALQTWTSNGILQLLSHVEDLSLPQVAKEKLNQCLENLSLASGEGIKLVRAGQVVWNLPAYLNQDDWAKLNTKSTVTDHLEVVAKRLAQMGVTSCRENTKHQAVSLILKLQTDQGRPEPSAQTIKTYCLDFQMLHKELTAGITPGPRVFPSRPQDLGTNWLTQVYGQCHPLGMQVSLAPWMTKVALRKTNKLLQVPVANEDEATSQKVAGYLEKLMAKHQPSQPQVVFATPAVASAVPQATATALVAPQLAQGQPATQEANSEQPKLPSQAVPMGQPAEPAALQDCQPSQPARKSLQQVEEEAYQKLQKKKPSLKKPAAAIKPQTSAKPKATSKAPALKKKPAAKPEARAKNKAGTKTRTGLIKGPGCCKCRGQGCSTCGSPTFNGTIIPGPAAYKAWIGRS